MTDHRSSAQCQCGAVVLALDAPPILTNVCTCDDCQAAGHLLEGREGAPDILGPQGGTAYALVRKDRVTCTQGAAYLRAHRLRDGTPTLRGVAICCNSLMFADFTNGHWLSIAQDRFAPAALPASVPHYDRQGVGFALRLVTAWAAMGFKRPRFAPQGQPLPPI